MKRLALLAALSASAAYPLAGPVTTRLLAQAPVALPRHTNRQRRSARNQSMAQLRRQAKRRRNIRARSPMRRKG